VLARHGERSEAIQIAATQNIRRLARIPAPRSRAWEHGEMDGFASLARHGERSEAIQIAATQNIRRLARIPAPRSRAWEHGEMDGFAWLAMTVSRIAIRDRNDP
jgi:hypothetical protein